MKKRERGGKKQKRRDSKGGEGVMRMDVLEAEGDWSGQVL